ncbi:MAG: TlpA family protein disulfide reductase [Oscillospiraceae bacterium]|nr:TlpA family protein disulfide reductase [Oscillospiraceae bacterium]
MKKNILISVVVLIIAALVVVFLIYPDIVQYLETRNDTGRVTGVNDGYEGGEVSAERTESLAYEFTLYDLDGNSVSLSDFRGRKVFINFWATWCPHCTRMLPYINEIYEGDHEIEVLTINIRESTRDIERLMERNNYGFTVLLDSDGRVSGGYGVRPIPRSLLIDEDGYIIGDHLGAMNRAELMTFMELEYIYDGS